MTLPPDADEWWLFDATMDREQYVRQTLEEYRTTPTTCGQIRPADRNLALRLYQMRIPFTAVDGALILASARRTFRDPKRPPLSPIRSLKYFLPIISEILDTPVDPVEISYLWLRMQGRL
ncbi:MAG: hypothetical protein GY856_42885 [bacterium]|nr:hypothetical protein [bacterium]